MNVRSHLVRLVFAALVPVTILSAALVLHVGRQERAANEASLRNVARALTQSVDTEVSRTITTLELLAETEPLRQGDYGAIRDRLEAAMRIHGRWSNVVLIGEGGERLVNLRVPRGTPPPPAGNNQGWREALASGRPHVTGVYRSRITDHPAVSVMVPVRSGGAPRYVLSAIIEYERWTELLKAQLPEGWIAAIDDRDGVIFARSERPEAFVGKEAAPSVRALYAAGSAGGGRSTNREGADIEVAFNTSALTGWHTLVIVPVEVLEAPARRSLVVWGAGTALIFALALGGAFYAARPLSAGIEGLREAVETLGRTGSPRAPASTVAEVQAAGAAIEDVARTLEQRAAEVARLQQQLSERAEAAEEASRLKDRFLGTLGHELRNPLAAISGAAAVLTRLGQGDTRRMADIVQRQTRHLTALVGDLLDVSRAASGKIELRRAPADLAAIAREALESFSASDGLARHRLESRLDEAPVFVDVERVSQVVRNLLENAVRYTPPGGRIRLATGREGREAFLEVADEGVGIEPQLLAHVFEPFVQGPQSLDRGQGGLGLGLAITRHIVERHEGRIAAESRGHGLGARFVVHLPLRSEPAAAPPDPSPSTALPGPLRIVVIEDHEDTRRSLATLLAARGHDVSEATDGESGLAILQAARHDAAFVDIGLPGLDGFEVVRRARAGGCAMRLVALTGYGQAADQEAAIAAGFDDFLVKPACPERLEEALRRVARAEP